MKQAQCLAVIAGCAIWAIGLAECPQTDESRFIQVDAPEAGSRVLVNDELSVEITDHDYDTVRVSVNDEGTPLTIVRASLTDEPGPKSKFVRRIGPRRSGADVIIGESQRKLFVRTFKGQACRSEAEVDLFGGDSRVSAVIIGISDYQWMRDLEYGVRDATEFESYLRSNIPADELNVKPLQGAEATSRNIRTAIYEAAAAASASGTLLVYFSGHGSLEVDFAGAIDAYFVPQDARPEVITDLIPHEEVLNLISRTRAGNKILISDSCFSAVSLRAPSQAAPRTVGISKSLMRVDRPSLIQQAISRKSEWDTTNTEVLWFSSSDSGEVSYESSSLRHGIFTNYLLTAAAAAAGANSYKNVRDFIKGKIVDLHEGVQTPELFGSAGKQDMRFPLKLDGGGP
jgi:hypothetical protein